MYPSAPVRLDQLSHQTSTGNEHNQSLRQYAEISQEDEISVGEIIESFVRHWKKLTGGAIIGSLLGLAGWFFSAHQAELTINTSKGTIDFVSWRNIVSALPNLAQELVQRNKLKAEDELLYQQMSAPTWWKKNVTPTYTISKSDAKDLSTISKELQDTAGTSIVNLVIRSSSSNTELAIGDVYKIASFIRAGSIFLEVKNLLRLYESEAQALVASTQKLITNAEVELAYLNQRAENLESLRQHFPGGTGASVQNLLDPKDSAAKYLPISTQLVAVKTEINNTQESLTRMRDRLAQQQLFDIFLKDSITAAKQEWDGVLLIEKLLAAEQDLRKSIDKSDIKQLQVVERIRADLIGIRTRFSTLFDSSLAPTTHRSSPMLPATLGSFGGGMLAFLFVFVMSTLSTRRSMLNTESQRAQG